MSLPRLRLPLIGLVLTLLLGSAGGAHARPFATAEASSLPPSITALSGQMIAGSWVAGSQTISLSADAPTGISHVAVLIDGGTVSDHHYHCDFSQPIPCSNLANEPLTVSTATLSDGWHHIKLQITDGAGQVTNSTNYLFGVSNTPPGPVRAARSNASSWSKLDVVGISWKRAVGDPAPVTKTFYTIDHRPSRTGGTLLAGDPLHMTLSPSDGDHTVWIWQEDAAGNVGVANARSVRIRIDRAPPALGAGQLSNKNRTLSVPVSDPGSGFASIRSAQALEVGRYDPYYGDDLPLSASKHDAKIVVSLPSPLRRGRWEIQIKTTDHLGNTGENDTDVGVPYPAPPANQAIPTISGQPVVGVVLQADPGSWASSPRAFSYVWESCVQAGGPCAAIPGSGGPTYRVGSAQAGHTLQVLVVAANITSSGQAVSTATAAVSAGASASSQVPSTAQPPLTGAQRQYLSVAVHGVRLARRYWGNRKFHWYNGLLKDPKPYPQASIWDAVSLFESVDEIALASPSRAHIRAVIRFADHAQSYWDKNLKPGPGYVPYPGGHGRSTKTFFDDNSVWGLAFMDAYRATGKRRYLADARRAMGFVIAHAWDQADGGGLWWNTWHAACAGPGPTCRLTTRRHSEVLAMATDLAARLYAATGHALYLHSALRYIAWANAHLLKWDGTYAAQIPGVQTMPHDGEGTLIDAFTTLCQAGASVPTSLYGQLPPNSYHRNPSARRPADPTSWCSWAESLAHKTVFGIPIGRRVFDRYVPLNEGPQWDAIYLRGLLTLYGFDRKPIWYRVVAGTAARSLKNAVDSRGRFLKAWNGSQHIDNAGPGMLRTHASSVSVLANLAASPPPTS